MGKERRRSFGFFRICKISCVNFLFDEFRAISSLRCVWEKHWGYLHKCKREEKGSVKSFLPRLKFRFLFLTLGHFLRLAKHLLRLERRRKNIAKCSRLFFSFFVTALPHPLLIWGTLHQRELSQSLRMTMARMISAHNQEAPTEVSGFSFSLTLL